MIEGARSVASFFRDCLLRALSSRRVKTSELAESYLVHLLSDLANPSRRPAGPGKQTLVEMLNEAHEARGADKARLYRELGDNALVWSGVFRERLLHQGMSLSYYESVGGGAYRKAGHLHRVLRASPIDDLCLELGDKFSGLSDALDEAAPLGVDASDEGLVKLMGRFARSQRPWMRDFLRQEGLDPEGISN